jgi:hypothetical protein
VEKGSDLELSRSHDAAEPLPPNAETSGQNAICNGRGKTMSINTFMKIAGAVAILFGIGWLVFPRFMAATYGVVVLGDEILVTRFLGLTSIGWGLVGVLVSQSTDWTALRGAAVGSAVGNILGVVVSAWYTIHGNLNPMGWSAVILYAIFFLGFAYYALGGEVQVARRA